MATESLSKCGEEVEWKDEAVDKVLEMVFGEEGKTWGPEKVALAVKMQRMWPDKEWKKLLGPTLKHGDVLHTGNMVALSKILRVSAFSSCNVAFVWCNVNDCVKCVGS